MTMTRFVEVRFIPAVGADVAFDSDGKPWFKKPEHAVRYRKWKRDQDALAAEADRGIPYAAENKRTAVNGVQSVGMYTRSGWKI
jgi:hypothetical protein